MKLIPTSLFFCALANISRCDNKNYNLTRLIDFNN